MKKVSIYNMLRFIPKVEYQVLDSRNDRRRTEVSLRRKASMLATILALIALLVGSVFGDRGILHVLEQRERAEALRRELDELRTENARLAAQIHALKTDPRAVEGLAREELDLARPGELVFLLKDEAPRADVP